MEHWSDKDILAGCIRGEPEAQEAFVRRYSNLIYKTIQSSLKIKNIRYTQDDLNDLHNGIFLKFFEAHCNKLRQYKGKNRCSVASWVRLVTVRIVLDHVRKYRTDAMAMEKRHHFAEDICDLAGRNREPWIIIDKEQKLQLLINALNGLFPRDRLFLRLHCMKGLPIQQVAQLMGISNENAYSIKHRAIKRLRSKIESFMDK